MSFLSPNEKANGGGEKHPLLALSSNREMVTLLSLALHTDTQ